MSSHIIFPFHRKLSNNLHSHRIQQYKEKIAEWSFGKNISSAMAHKLNKIVNERKPKDTKFYLGSRSWSAEDIAKKCARGGPPEASPGSGKLFVLDIICRNSC